MYLVGLGLLLGVAVAASGSESGMRDPKMSRGADSATGISGVVTPLRRSVDNSLGPNLSDGEQGAVHISVKDLVEVVPPQMVNTESGAEIVHIVTATPNPGAEGFPLPDIDEHGKLVLGLNDGSLLNALRAPRSQTSGSQTSGPPHASVFDSALSVVISTPRVGEDDDSDVTTPAEQENENVSDQHAVENMPSTKDRNLSNLRVEGLKRGGRSHPPQGVSWRRSVTCRDFMPNVFCGWIARRKERSKQSKRQLKKFRREVRIDGDHLSKDGESSLATNIISIIVATAGAVVGPILGAAAATYLALAIRYNWFRDGVLNSRHHFMVWYRRRRGEFCGGAMRGSGVSRPGTKGFPRGFRICKQS